MGLGNSEDAVVDDGGGGGGGKTTYSAVSCSICLEVVADNGERSWAKLQCGHQFHLDCIGSAFNVKGIMQCPNCRKIEKGQWLYANGSRSSSEFNMEDWSHDEDFYDLGYSGMSFGVHWCPFGQLARLPASFERLPLSYEEGEFPLAQYHDMLGQHAIFNEHAAVSSATHPCPYVAYVGPIHPSSSNANGNVSDSSNFSTHWSGSPAATEMPSSYTFPTMDIHYHSWEHHFSPFSTSNGRVGPADQPSIPPALQRSARATLDMPRTGSFMHPLLVGHSSGSRAGSSVTPSMVPPYQGSNARAHDRVQALQAYYQQQPPGNSPLIRTPIASGNRRTSSHRGTASAGHMASSPGQTGGFYVFPPSTFDRNYQEPENPVPSRFHSWARDLPPMSLNQVDRDSSWGPFHLSANLPNSGISSGSFRQRHGSERTS